MENEDIFITHVPRALDLKSKLFGFELPDLLFIFMNLALTNFIFGSTSVRYVLVWGSTVAIAGVLYFAKRGRPDNFIQHLGEFFIQPTYRAAGLRDFQYRRFSNRGGTNEE